MLLFVSMISHELTLCDHQRAGHDEVADHRSRDHDADCENGVEKNDAHGHGCLSENGGVETGIDALQANGSDCNQYTAGNRTERNDMQ